jgi:hypothetical protein
LFGLPILFDLPCLSDLPLLFGLPCLSDLPA